jgi:hypothetical protein
MNRSGPVSSRIVSALQHRALQVRTRAERGFASIPRYVQGFRFGRRLDGDESAPDGESPDDGNPLRRYFESHTSGDGITKWSHYFDIYHRHFVKFVGTPVKILEIGVYSGGSLQMWREYFGADCTVYGVDIEPACAAYARAGVEIFIGDQADPDFWARFRSQVPELDIVVDDGGHETEQQVVSLEGLLAHLRPGGVYLCEDVAGLANPFHAYAAGLGENLHERRPMAPGVMRPNSFQRLVDSIHVYPYVTVFERAPANRPPLISAHRGTAWQRFDSGRM